MKILIRDNYLKGNVAKRCDQRKFGVFHGHAMLGATSKIHCFHQYLHEDHNNHIPFGIWQIYNDIHS